MTRESAYLMIDGEMFGQYGFDSKGDVGVTGHNASKRLRDHHYTTLSHVNSWRPIDGGPWQPGEMNLSMNVWERCAATRTPPQNRGAAGPRTPQLSWGGPPPRPPETFPETL